ncbi:MAG: NAD(P)-dependent oxidoreductase [Actinomycetales bacterium]|nr:NAD(P)-dependent oxidoreductase [Candidatus Lutibacillus vidarii]
MKVLVLGATGLLGHRVCRELATRGIDVAGVSRRGGAAPGAPAGIPVTAYDSAAASDGELRDLLTGYDALVYALGPDDRERVRGSAREFFTERLVGPTARVAAAAGEVGVGRLVILGSYFAAMHRVHPQWRLAERHPYVAARVEQTQAARAAAGATDVVTLEIPYVFGVVPGIEPMWKSVLFDVIRRSPVVPAPPGGTAVVTVVQVGQAVATLVESGAPDPQVAVGDANLTFTTLFGIIADELGLRRPRVRVPVPLLTVGMAAELVSMRLKGLDSGLDPLRLAPDLLGRSLYVDLPRSRSVLRHETGGVEAAIRASVRAAYPGL